MTEKYASNAQLPKVAMVVTRFPSLSQTFIALQIAELVKAGFSVDIFNLGEVGKDEWLPEGTQKIFSSLNIYHYQKIMDSHEAMARSIALSESAFFRKLTVRKRLKILPIEKYKELTKLSYFFQPIKSADIIHYQCLDLGKKAIRLKRYGFRMDGIRQLCALRGSDVTKDNNVKKIDWKQLDKFFDFIMPVCEIFKENIIAAGCASPVEVVPSPVNTESLLQIKVNRRPNSTLEFVSVGRLVEKKGIQYAISMCAMLKQDGVQFKYTVVGEGPLRNNLQNQVDELGLSDNVSFLGALPSKEALVQMAKADILLAPSCRATNGDSEGIPNVIKEAMLLGLQVVTTRHSGIPELIRHEENGYLSNERCADSLFSAVKDALHNNENWSAIAARAKRDVIDRYTPNVTIKPLVKIYEVGYHAS